MDREFTTLLVDKLRKQAEDFSKKSEEESNSLTSSTYKALECVMHCVALSVVETFNELDGKK